MCFRKRRTKTTHANTGSLFSKLAQRDCNCTVYTKGRENAWMGKRPLMTLVSNEENSWTGCLLAVLSDSESARSSGTGPWYRRKLVHYERTDGLHISQSDNNLISSELVWFFNYNGAKEVKLASVQWGRFYAMFYLYTILKRQTSIKLLSWAYSTVLLQNLIKIT